MSRCGGGVAAEAESAYPVYGPLGKTAEFSLGQSVPDCWYYTVKKKNNNNNNFAIL